MCGRLGQLCLLVGLRRVSRVDEQRNRRRAGYQFVQQFDMLCTELTFA
jgi:hypothetical protein